VDQVIGVVGLENAVMDQRMAPEWIRKRPDRPVHEKLVQDPLKDRSVSNGG
jgi:hypothetical protein